MAAGETRFPGARITSYGHEVHLFLTFATHPAFLRIDFSPPLRGGMIDLEFFGVSKVDLGSHPDVTLPALTAFLRALDFEATVEGTRVRARYDKERATGHDDILDHAEAMLRLTPWLMDLDWILGGLDLPPRARTALFTRWSALFRRWGTLPLAQLLTVDRRGVLLRRVVTPEGEREERWDGDEPVRDRWLPPPDLPLRERIESSLRELGLDLPAVAIPAGEAPGQLELETLLEPLRDARRAGLVVRREGGGFARRPGIARIHEARVLAAILAGPAERLLAAARLGAVLRPLERALSRRATGRVGRGTVQRARLRAGGTTWVLALLVDPQGLLVAAAAAPAPGFLHRDGDPERFPVGEELALVLRRENLVDDDAPPALSVSPEEFAALARGEPPPLPDPEAYPGIRVSPGRAVGRALVGEPGTDPRRADGRIVVSPTFTPESAALLHHAAGLVTTGGGALSHAGMLAAQLGKPALVIDGRWTTHGSAVPRVLYALAVFEPRRSALDGWEIVEFAGLRDEESALDDGDVVVVDGDAGVVRVLGGDREALGLYESLKRYAEAQADRRRAETEEARLAASGRRLQACHAVEKALGRLSRPALVRHAVDEILFTPPFQESAATADALRFLRRLLAPGTTREAALERLVRRREDLESRRRESAALAAALIPDAAPLYEVLRLRLTALRAAATADHAAAILDGAGVPGAAAGDPPPPPHDVDALARARIESLRSACADAVLDALYAPDQPPWLRHRLDELSRLDRVLETPRDTADAFAHVHDRLRAADRAADDRLAGRRVLRPEDGGVEMAPLVGWKAANLAEIRAAAGDGVVPSWFAITRSAFEEMLAGDVAARDALLPARIPLGEGVLRILHAPELAPAERARRIRALWAEATWPAAVRDEILDAYRALGDDAAVAVRSSSREEDREAAARAGEFDTFLFVEGDDDLLDHVKRAWSGLWSERAIVSREIQGIEAGGWGGGVLVQRMVRSRVAGVVQTVNVADVRRRELVVSAGLGLGEGVVSGRVNADHIVVARDERFPAGPLRFRYEVREKPMRVDVDPATGRGTVLVETLYHQRLRPALEYVELVELVGVAERLERHYRRPLDLEFAWEGDRLWILQARAVPSCLAVFRETVERRPLRRAGDPGPREILR